MENLSPQINDADDNEEGSPVVVDSRYISRQASDFDDELISDDDDDTEVRVTIPRVILAEVKRATERTGHSNIYHPSFISIGPYHHGKPELHQAEVIKKQFLEDFVSKSDGKDKSFFYNKIFEEISEVRACYEDIHYNDQVLTEIMLLDACFLIHFLKFQNLSYTDFGVYFGATGMKFVHCDIWMLENQIPLWIIKKAYCSHPYHQQTRWDILLYNFIASKVYWRNLDLTKIVNKSFHLLSALRFVTQIKVMDSTTNHDRIRTRSEWTVSSDFSVQKASFRFRSITNLKAKGIFFKPVYKQNIRFTSHSFYGQLEMPVISLQYNSFTKYSNILAYDMSSLKYGDLQVASYLNFLKSLIEGPNDVRELRESGILFNCLDNDEEVVRLFKDIDCAGWGGSVYNEMKAGIEKHCSSKTKTWKAEVINTYFRSPLTATALFGAIALLILALLQTIFAIIKS